MKYAISVALCFALLACAGVFICNYYVLPKGIIPNNLMESKEESQNENEAELTPQINDEDNSQLSFDTVEAVDVEKESKKPSITISSLESFPGDMLVIRGENVDEIPTVKTILNEDVNVYKLGEDKIMALIPIKYTKEAGEYYINVLGSDFSKDFLITLKNKEFPKVDIKMDENTVAQTIDSKKANDEYFQKVQPLKTINREEILWKENFIEPVNDYETTSEYGEIRTVNGAPSDRHGGIDMAAPIGTPVYAVNDGEVLFADNIVLTGNTIMIEHGLGLKSHYYHMDKLFVKKGDIVKKGQKIGEVGTTGFSTGPHLHFAFSVEKIYINPHMLFEGFEF